LNPWKESDQRISGRGVTSITIAEKAPPAPVGTPFGAGTSDAASSPAPTAWAVPTWPRISPPGFFLVCTLTYALPDASADSTLAFSGAAPFWPDRHGPQSGTTTGPARPGLPMWMCAASAAPFSLVKVSDHEIVDLPPVRVTIPRNNPPAPALTPFAAGRSPPRASDAGWAVPGFWPSADGAPCAATTLTAASKIVAAVPRARPLRIVHTLSLDRCGRPRLRSRGQEGLDRPDGGLKPRCFGNRPKWVPVRRLTADGCLGYRWRPWRTSSL